MWPGGEGCGVVEGGFVDDHEGGAVWRCGLRRRRRLVPGLVLAAVTEVAEAGAVGVVVAVEAEGVGGGIGGGGGVPECGDVHVLASEDAEDVGLCDGAVECGDGSQTVFAEGEFGAGVVVGDPLFHAWDHHDGVADPAFVDVGGIPE